MAFWPISEVLVATSRTPNVLGGPLNWTLYIDVSVYMRISRLVLIAETINEPELSLRLPAVFTFVGVQSTKLSWSGQRIRRVSWVPAPMSLQPIARRCRSSGETTIILQTVGTSEAEGRVVRLTALVVVPLVTSHVYMPPSLTLATISSPKLSIDQIDNTPPPPAPEKASFHPRDPVPSS